MSVARTVKANKTEEESSAMKENAILPAPQHQHAQKPVLTRRRIYTVYVCVSVCSGILPAHVGPHDSGIPTCGQTNGLIKSLTPRAAREKHAEWRASTMQRQDEEVLSAGFSLLFRRVCTTRTNILQST